MASGSVFLTLLTKDFYDPIALNIHVTKAFCIPITTISYFIVLLIWKYHTTDFDQIHPSHFSQTHYYLHSHETRKSLSFILSPSLLLSLPPYLSLNTISFICVAQIHSNTLGCGVCLEPWFPSQSKHPYQKLILLSPLAINYQ